MIADVNTNSTIIANTIKTETEKVGYALSNEMITIWNAEQGTIQDATKVITAYIGSTIGAVTDLDLDLEELMKQYAANEEQDRLQAEADKQENNKTQQAEASAQASLNTSVGYIDTNLEKYIDWVQNTAWVDLSKIVTTIKDTVVKISDQLIAMASPFASGDNGSTSVDTPTGTETSTKPTQDTPSKSSTPKVGTVLKATGTWYEASDGTGDTGNVKLNGATSWEVEKINDGSKYPYHLISYNSKGKKVGSGWVKLSQLSGYARGARRIDEDQAAWTQENGQEYIIRPSDGAILTPLAKRDSVLTATATQNIWDMANNPGQFIRDNMVVTATIPNVKTVDTTNGAVETSMHIEFILPNVSDYNSFISHMQRDKKFEKMVQDMTINQLSGGSQLAKYRYKF